MTKARNCAGATFVEIEAAFVANWVGMLRRSGIAEDTPMPEDFTRFFFDNGAFRECSVHPDHYLFNRELSIDPSEFTRRFIEHYRNVLPNEDVGCDR